jgi:hypothetical protein
MACCCGIAAADRLHGVLLLAVGSSSRHSIPEWGDMVMPPLCNRLLKHQLARLAVPSLLQVANGP